MVLCAGRHAAIGGQVTRVVFRGMIVSRAFPQVPPVVCYPVVVLLLYDFPPFSFLVRFPALVFRLYRHTNWQARERLGSLRNHDGDAEDNVDMKTNLLFTNESCDILKSFVLFLTLRFVSPFQTTCRIFFREMFFYQSKNYLYVYTGQFENLKARTLKSIYKK